MQNTGRLKAALRSDLRRILFDSAIEDQLLHEMPYFVMVDRAHLIMLAEQQIITSEQVVRLLEVINELEETHFDCLRSLSAPRGLFLLYEDYLIQKLGFRTGGLLQTARSRNDLSATILKLRARKIYSRLLHEALRLQAILLAKARKYSRLTMPIYTHGQPGMPGTYGHYLLAVAQALSRDLDGLERAATDLAVCPLGAGAAGGTTLAINTQRSAELLGFERGPGNSIDAVASRDLVIRLLAASSILGITLSRAAADLFQWTTQEFEFLRVPDDLAGSSSAMPQKRNPFLLEHIKGRSASPLGAFTSAAMAMHAAPFSNCIAVGTEAVRPLWNALEDVMVASTFLRSMVMGAVPNNGAMLKSAANGLVTATELANCIVTGNNLDYRTAHRLVGEAICTAMEQDRSLECVLSNLKKLGVVVDDRRPMEPSDVALRSEFGGGPGQRSFDLCFTQTRTHWVEHKKRVHQLEQRWKEAECRLTALSSELASTCAAAPR